jgi:hypothetical protein
MMKSPKGLGMLLLGVWLVLTGLIPLLSISVAHLGTVMSVLAVAAGALVLMGRSA